MHPILQRSFILLTMRQLVLFQRRKNQLFFIRGNKLIQPCRDQSMAPAGCSSHARPALYAGSDMWFLSVGLIQTGSGSSIQGWSRMLASSSMFPGPASCTTCSGCPKLAPCTACAEQGWSETHRQHSEPDDRAP